mgnify:CR=1 FL=1
MAFIAKQNALGVAGSQAEWAVPSNDGSPLDSTIISPSRFASLYSPLSTLGSSLARVVGSGNQGGVPSLPTLLRRDFPLPTDNGFDIPSLPTGELFQTPTAQFVLGLYYYNEPLLLDELISFVLIWIAVLIYLNELRKE